MFNNSPPLSARNPYEGNPTLIPQESIIACIMVSAFLLLRSFPKINLEKLSIIHNTYLYDYWLYFRLCILQAPPPLLHGIHCFGMPWLIMQASHLQINKIANLSLHHGILCLHIVCCCSDRYMEAINQCQIQYCGLVVYTLYCKYNFEEDYFKFVYTKLFC